MNIILILTFIAAVSFVAIRIYLFWFGLPSAKKKLNDLIPGSTNKVEPELLDNDSERISLPIDIYYSKDESLINLHFERYFQALIKRIRKAKTSIIVFDHIDHLINTGAKSEFSETAKRILQKKYKEYFDVIEEMVTKSGVKYTRILMIPRLPEALKLVIFNDHKLPVYDHSNDAHKEKTLQIIYEPTVKHLKSLFDKCISKDLIDNFSLFVIHPPFRPVSSIIIDSETLIDEIDSREIDEINSTDDNSQSFPDRLDINLGSHEERIYEIQKMISRFERLAPQRKSQLEKDMFFYFIENVQIEK